MQPQTVVPRGPEPRPKKQPYKDPKAALAWAFLAPGSGQFFVGHFWRGMLMFGLSWFCFIGYFWGIADAYYLAEKANRRETYANDDYVRHAQVTLPIIAHGLFWILFFVGLLVLWGFVQERFLLLHSF